MCLTPGAKTFSLNYYLFDAQEGKFGTPCMLGGGTSFSRITAKALRPNKAAVIIAYLSVSNIVPLNSMVDFFKSHFRDFVFIILLLPAENTL